MLKRSWIEIDLDKIVNNYKIYSKNIGFNQEVMAVVKADAYGHGDRKVAMALQEIGCKHFAVSNIEEAKSIRDAGVTGQILILGYTPVEYIDDLLKYDVTQTLLSEEYAELFKDRGIKAQFAIDTGMNRIGLDGDDPAECERIIRKFKDGYQLTGIFTHLCVADTPSEKDFTIGQINKFDRVVKSVEDLNLQYIHCMNTAGGLCEAPYGNLVRLGVSMYGLKPDYDMDIPSGIKPALVWKSVISQIKVVHPGETIGYGRTYRVNHDMRIATIPTGYADGYNRLLSNKAVVLIHGKKAPVVGRVCMDQLMVDVSGIPEAQFAEEVFLLGEGYNADDMAHDMGTIGYEIICDIGKRVNKVYLEKGEDDGSTIRLFVRKKA